VSECVCTGVAGGKRDDGFPAPGDLDVRRFTTLAEDVFEICHAHLPESAHQDREHKALVVGRLDLLLLARRLLCTSVKRDLAKRQNRARKV
jgi:hypothetical protein